MQDNNCCSYTAVGNKLQVERGSDYEWEEHDLTDYYDVDHKMTMCIKLFKKCWIR